MQIISIGDNLHENVKTCKEKYFKVSSETFTPNANCYDRNVTRTWGQRIIPRASAQVSLQRKRNI